MTTPTSFTNRGGHFLLRTPEAIFTPEQFAGDEALMIQTAEQFTRQEVLPIQDRLDAQEDGLTPALVRKAGELGMCGIDSPEAFGGLGLHKNLAARMLEFLSLNASFSVTIGITSGISQVGLVLFGNDDQRRRYLPHLTSGEQIGAYALSEPNSGSDALSMTTRAERHGDTYRLTGTKMWISNAKWADQFIVMAKVDGERVSAFLVERGFPGVSVAREEHKMGLKGSSTARLILEDAEVPAANLLHEEGKGHQVAFNALNLGRFKLSSMSLGPAREALGLASRYAQERRQFGRPIAEFGLIRQKLADSAAKYFLAESVTYRTGAMIDEAFAALGGTVEGNRLAAEEFACECSASKILATEAEAEIVDDCLQVFGGYGFTEEFPIARVYRDARVSRIYEGTNEINRIFLADRLAKRLAPCDPWHKTDESSFVAELAAKAYRRIASSHAMENLGKSLDQRSVGALSDLTMLAYAEQSARLRAAQTGGINQALFTLLSPLLAQRAARAYQLLTGESVTLPACQLADVDSIAEAVLDGTLPLRH